MNEEHTALAEWDAAYVLGALVPADRRRFEAHLEGCDRCREAVAELAPMPGLLARAGWHDAAPAPEPPADLLERLQDRARARVRATRLRIAGLAAAAALILALAIGVPAGLRQADEPDVAVAMESDVMAVEVDLEEVAWGTRMSIRCEYPEGAYSYGGGAYELVVTDVDGGVHAVSSWVALPGRTIALDAATSIPLERIASLAVRSGGGDVLLTAEVGDPE